MDGKELGHKQRHKILKTEVNDLGYHLGGGIYILGDVLKGTNSQMSHGRNSSQMSDHINSLMSDGRIRHFKHVEGKVHSHKQRHKIL